MKEKTKYKAEETKDISKEYAEDSKEKAEDLAHGFNKEKAQNVGKKTMETVKDAWETAKSTAQKVTEAVAGSGEEADRARDGVDKGLEDLLRKTREN
ncbi:Late embryogenesis abundant protein [Hirschfeldia incana]|nr:Late embryogenesis abundant protein [Hirschfeldia incana]